MKKLLNILLLFVNFTFLTSCNVNSQNTDCDKKDSLNFVKSSYGCTYFKYFKSDSLLNNPNLVILLHGDAPFNPPSYQYKLGKILERQTKNTIIVAVLRPGYTDNEGNHSDGIKGNTTGDNYTMEVINNLTEVVKELKIRYKPNQTIIVGHSGGAAISADIISSTSNLIDKSVLVSCPCDVEKWRSYMSSKQPFYRPWKDSVKSISPIKMVDSLNSKVTMTLIHGTKDDVVPFDISNNYYQKLKNRDINVKLIKLDNEGHEIFLSDIVVSTIKNCLNK